MASKTIKDITYREKVYELVRQIPYGRVMTYGQIARILGEEYTPRKVGFVMRLAEEDKVPWHRVINSRGGCSTAKLTIPVNLQQKMLEEEGIEFDEKGFCDLDKYLWNP
ncbi:MAG: MGMT family protein [Pyrinomonadaceae bacterium]|nr:MGMT family protein [Pyrinomonadaceae bacterium]MCX7639251.1 MGMT family protein [Pyrinomonadaceae bacterium]MDW8303527.1 MGMT family protein [Acidobacteriota bacterium]